MAGYARSDDGFTLVFDAWFWLILLFGSLLRLGAHRKGGNGGGDRRTGAAPIQNGVVVITDEKIVAVGRQGVVTVPSSL